MARPSIKDGWFKMSHELDAAVSYAGFNRAESVVLRHVRKEIFFPSLKKIAVLSPSAIARGTSLHRVSISKAIASLTESGVLEKVEGGHRFIKDYELWTWQGNPRFTPEEVRLFQSEGKHPRNAKADKACSESVTEGVADRLQGCSGSATGGVTESLHGCSGLVTGGVTESLQACSGLVTGGVTDSLQSRARAIEERAELDLIQREKKREEEKRVHNSRASESNAGPEIETIRRLVESIKAKTNDDTNGMNDDLYVSNVRVWLIGNHEAQVETVIAEAIAKNLGGVSMVRWISTVLSRRKAEAATLMSAKVDKPQFETMGAKYDRIHASRKASIDRLAKEMFDRDDRGKT